MHNIIKGGATPCNMSLPESIYYTIFTFTMYKLNLGKPQIYTQSIFTTSANSVAQLVGTSARSPLDSPTLRSPCRTIMLFAQLGRTSKSPHTGASARDTPPSQPNTPTSLRAHLHDGQALARVAKTPMPSRRTNGHSSVSPSGTFAQIRHHTRARPNRPSGTTHNCARLPPNHRAHLHPQPRSTPFLHAASPRMGACMNCTFPP